ncbi:glycoside hydrolase family 3 N-terminal domain-containing protein [Okibacterium endophyticum]
MSPHPVLRRGSASRARRALGAALLVVFALTACTGEGSAPPEPTASAPETTAEPRPDATVAWARRTLASMSLEEKIASTLMLHVPGTDAARIRSFVETHQPGGLILMGDNMPADVDALNRLVIEITPDPRVPLLIGIDQEGGEVKRIESDHWPAARSLKFEEPAAAETAFAARAQLLSHAGVNINFGIVADVTADPGSFIYGRALGTTPDSAAERVAAAVRGESGEVLSTLKHFPGHGSAPGDSHVSVPSTAKTFDDWLASDAVPFVSGIDAGAGAVMFGHLAYTAVDPQPASLSPGWHDVLHNDLGFDGITITDDMGMLVNTGLPEYQNPSENVIRALAAGNTMILYILGAVDPATIVADVVAAVEQGRIAEQQIDDAALRLLVERRQIGAEWMPMVRR